MATLIRPSHNPIIQWWRDHVVASVEHVRVVEKVHEESGWSPRYLFMTLVSAGIAVLGLLLSSPAVVIGAMLISPLMGPIIGLGFGIATFDSAEIRRSGVALGGGTMVAILFCALVVMLSPLQNVTSEIAARTQPNLFDLMIALFSALAGAYAMIRGREGTIVGVAIATALMPPLAVVGFGLATLNWTVFSGALLLFFTNLMTIALTAAVMARLYGFAHRLSPQQTLLQSVAIAIVFIALAIPLGFTLRNIAWQTTASRDARDVVASQFGDNARISQIDVDYKVRPVKVSATVLTPHLVADAEKDSAMMLGKLLGEPVSVAIEQYRVGTGAADAEAAQLAQAQANAQKKAAADHAVTQLATELAVVAGTDQSAVLVDREAHRAVVTAKPLSGADLAAYRTLEARVAQTAIDWRITLVPPAAALDDVTFRANPDEKAGGEIPDAAGQAAIATAIWGAERLNLPIAVAGPKDHADQVADALTKAGVTVVRQGTRGGAGGTVTLRWQAPSASD
ncbi:DUF389 domain-containing protein [Hephaestia mangrovi]|uniref:DUF389 domain-containing protein n=1 Tax=Hephaestia mangrovi TaxID=2873268 RepID=UPI001CA70FF9|nr:DUF389 domain-containing protein [Hephaestia mangrovi]MBY8828433.1 DUF389 domain-containing protein [Hephaestia mangrovi]